ncbi:MAG: SH3 domain-containing protein [Termitinemataceae bacterium]|nr:MAG: SH3 domain-containing protein [Termitinemataceae bacterium]
MAKTCKVALAILVIIPLFMLGSCKRSLGWGVMLWSSEAGGIPSGTIVKVLIKSNIENVWIVSVPQKYRKLAGSSKVEVPLAKLELCGTKAAAKKRLRDFAEYQLSYAETLQDGLPIRDEADNSARRVYRLRLGEVVKILEPTEGNPAISATGDPLPGQWFKVLTEDGTEGCCFSYRLRLFEHTIGEMVSSPEQIAVNNEDGHDVELDKVLSAKWVSSSYGDMITNNRLDIDSLKRHWGFFIGEDTGIANIYTQDVDLSFKYKKIISQGGRTWHFDGTNLSMRLRSPTILAVSYIDETMFAATGMNGAQKTILFISINSEIDDLIAQEEIRRQEKIANILDEGRNFASEFYGSLSLDDDASFTWENFDSLIPSVLPASVTGKGSIIIRYFIDDSLNESYDGALTMILKTAGGTDAELNFLYATDSGNGLPGLMLEHVPDWCIEEATVVARDTSPVSMFFYGKE